MGIFKFSNILFKHLSIDRFIFELNSDLSTEIGQFKPSNWALFLRSTPGEYIIEIPGFEVSHAD